jgi:hypothetical protein
MLGKYLKCAHCYSSAAVFQFCCLKLDASTKVIMKCTGRFFNEVHMHANFVDDSMPITFGMKAVLTFVHKSQAVLKMLSLYT